MKSLIVSMMVVFGVCTVCGAAHFRSDATGNSKDGKVIIKAVPGELRGSPFSWGKEEDRDATISFSAKTPAPTDTWTTYTYAFVAEGTGKVNVNFGAQWAKDPEKREWVYIDSIKLNGELIPNGDFAKTEKRGERVIVNGFWMHQKAEVVEGAGQEGGNAVRVNHDVRISKIFEVESGKTYTFSVTVKSAPFPAAAAAK